MVMHFWGSVMRVRATIQEGYLFSIDYWERPHWYTSKLAPMKITQNGYTFAAYDNVPAQMIEGETFLDTVHPTTRAISCATEFLEELGYTLNVYSGDFIKIEEMVALPVRTIDAVSQFRYVANHLPQLHYPVGSTRIIAIDGEFDLSNRVFKGGLCFE